MSVQKCNPDITSIAPNCSSRIRDILQREYDEETDYHRRRDPENFLGSRTWQFLTLVSNPCFEKCSLPFQKRNVKDVTEFSTEKIFCTSLVPSIQ